MQAGFAMVECGFNESKNAVNILFKNLMDLSIGVLLFGVALARLAWRHANPRPRPLGAALQSRIAVAVHRLLDGLLFALAASGYLISTADGRPIEVFELFSVPATLSGLQHQADIAGWAHQLLGYALLGLAALHAGAAFKHHFVDRDLNGDLWTRG